MKNKRDARCAIAREKVGTEEVLTRTYAVYDVTTVVPQVIRLGVINFGEAERIARECGKPAVVVETKTVLKVVRVVTLNL